MDEALGFTVGARGVRAGEEVAQAEPTDGGTEVMRAIAGAVVAHETLRFDAQGSEVSERVLEEDDGVWVALVGHDLGEGEARSIINADMDIFPASAVDLVATIMSDAVARAHDLAEFLNIEVEELAWELALVAENWWSGIEGAEPSQAVATQETRDGRFGAGALACDLKAWQTQTAQSEDHSDLRWRRLLGAAPRTRRAITQSLGSFGSETGQPLSCGPFAHGKSRRGVLCREPLFEHGQNKSFSTSGHQSGISMNVHALGLGG